MAEVEAKSAEAPAQLKGDENGTDVNKDPADHATTESAAADDSSAAASKLEKEKESAREERKQPVQRGRGGGGPRGRHGRGRGIKSDFTSLPESDDPDEIRKQVEFYFSDSNLVQDKFLLEQVGGSENRSVPIKTIHSFKRMRHFQPYSAVVNALKESEVLDVTEDEEIRRKEPLPESVGTKLDENTVKIFADKAQPRSIYAKGFGEEGPDTQVEIEEFFEPYGPVNAIRLRRHADKTFKGSVFVEFRDEDTQKAFLDLETKPKFNGKDLQIMSKKDYVEKKAEDIRAGKIKPNRRELSDDKDDWKSRRDRFQKNGFRDSRGGGGRGRGRGRNDRGRDRNDRDKSRSRSPAKNGAEEDVPTESAKSETEANTQPPETKKRAHEDDEDNSEQPETKKGKAEEAEVEA